PPSDRAGVRAPGDPHAPPQSHRIPLGTRAGAPMTAKKPSSDRIDVTIFGSTYTLRGGEDPEAVRALAATLDARMREIASPDADPLKVAILTALRLADETRESTEG